MVNPNKPLIHGPKNNRCLAAPAVWIAMVIILLMQQRLPDPQFMQDGFVSVAFSVFLQDGLAEHLGGHLLLDRQVVRMRELSVVIHRRVDGQAVFHSQQVVVLAVARRDMHETGSRRVLHKAVTGKEFARAIAEWMLVFYLADVPAVEA